MANDIKVSPTPIQRNLNDVAVELTQLYYKDNTASSVEDVKKTYIEFFKTALTAQRQEW